MEVKVNKEDIKTLRDQYLDYLRWCNYNDEWIKKYLEEFDELIENENWNEFYQKIMLKLG